MGKKHKRGPKQAGLAHKEAFQRMNYLYQVSEHANVGGCLAVAYSLA